MSYEWLFRLNINLFIIIYTCCGAEEMALEPRRRTGAEIGNQKIWLIPPGLLPLYRRKCKFNYLFVHVSRPKVRQHNLNGNGETIYLFTWLFLPQIQTVTVDMKLANKSQLFNHCVPIITVNNKWWGRSITFCGHFVFCHEIISAHFFGSLSIFDCLGGEEGTETQKGRSPGERVPCFTCQVEYARNLFWFQAQFQCSPYEIVYEGERKFRRPALQSSLGRSKLLSFWVGSPLL